jgi:hypothetical protein
MRSADDGILAISSSYSNVVWITGLLLISDLLISTVPFYCDSLQWNEGGTTESFLFISILHCFLHSSWCLGFL